jgi:hypothetical protein
MVLGLFVAGKIFAQKMCQYFIRQNICASPTNFVGDSSEMWSKIIRKYYSFWKLNWKEIHIFTKSTKIFLQGHPKKYCLKLYSITPLDKSLFLSLILSYHTLHPIYYQIKIWHKRLFQRDLYHIAIKLLWHIFTRQ